VIGYPSWQDGALLPTQDYPLCPARKIPPEKIIVNPLMTKLVWSRWLDIGLIPFCQFIDLNSASVHKLAISSHLDLTFGQ